MIWSNCDPQFAGSWILRVGERLHLLERPRIYAFLLLRDVLVDFIELLLQVMCVRDRRRNGSAEDGLHPKIK
jgi:hypothetical protein